MRSASIESFSRRAESIMRLGNDGKLCGNVGTVTVGVGSSHAILDVTG
jgi:hypothetical protein